MKKNSEIYTDEEFLEKEIIREISNDYYDDKKNDDNNYGEKYKNKIINTVEELIEELECANKNFTEFITIKDKHGDSSYYLTWWITNQIIVNKKQIYSSKCYVLSTCENTCAWYQLPKNDIKLLGLNPHSLIKA